MKPFEMFAICFTVFAITLLVIVELEKQSDDKIIKSMSCITLLTHVKHYDDFYKQPADYFNHPYSVQHYEDQYMQKCIGNDTQ